MADWEIKKVQMQLRRQRAQRLYSSRSRANSLGHFAVYYNDPELINSVWQQLRARHARPICSGSRGDILTKPIGTVVTTMPKAAAAKDALD